MNSYLRPYRRTLASQVVPSILILVSAVLLGRLELQLALPFVITFTVVSFIAYRRELTRSQFGAAGAPTSDIAAQLNPYILGIAVLPSLALLPFDGHYVRVAALLMLLLLNRRSFAVILKTPAILIPIATGLALAVGFARGVGVGHSVQDLLGPAQLMVGLVAGYAISKARIERRCVTALSVVVLLAAISKVLSVVSGLYIFDARVQEVAPGMAGGGVRVISGAEDVAIVLLALSTLLAVARPTLDRPQSRRDQIFAYVVVLASVALLLLSMARNLLLVSVVAVVVPIVVYPRRGGFARVARLSPLLIAAAALPLAASIALPSAQSYVKAQVVGFSDRVLKGSYSLDDDAWRSSERTAAIKFVRRNPVLGGGLGSPYRSKFVSETRSAEGASWGRWYIHNAYLWVMVKMGLVGLVAYGAFILWAWSCLWRLRSLSSDRTAVLSAVGIAVMVAMAVRGLVTPNAVLTIGALMLGTLAGLAYGEIESARSSRPLATAEVP